MALKLACACGDYWQSGAISCNWRLHGEPCAGHWLSSRWRAQVWYRRSIAYVEGSRAGCGASGSASAGHCVGLQPSVSSVKVFRSKMQPNGPASRIGPCCKLPPRLLLRRVAVSHGRGGSEHRTDACHYGDTGPGLAALPAPLVAPAVPHRGCGRNGSRPRASLLVFSMQEPALYVKRVVWQVTRDIAQWSPDTVPAGHLFVCGDNRQCKQRLARVGTPAASKAYKELS